MTAVSSTTITVAGVTCAVPTALAGKVGSLKTGDVVEIRCELVDNALTLTKVQKKGKHDKDD